MLINFTKKHQFNTRLRLKSSVIEQVPEGKSLGTILSDQLTWDKNCKNIIKKFNVRIKVLGKVASFGTQAHLCPNDKSNFGAVLPGLGQGPYTKRTKVLRKMPKPFTKNNPSFEKFTVRRFTYKKGKKSVKNSGTFIKMKEKYEHQAHQDISYQSL